MIWTVFDVSALLLFLGGVLYGLIAGIRASLYVLVTLLAAVLAILSLTGVFESLVLMASSVNLSVYEGAPAVAVLLLEGKNTAAFIAALVPSLLLVFCILVLVTGKILLKDFLPSADNRTGSRIGGLFIGAAAGLIAVLLFAAQLTRLPWPPALISLRGSILINLLQNGVPSLLPLLAGNL